MKNPKQKLYCYVDETGQDTKGKLFIVSVVVTKEDREEIVDLLEKLEEETGKKATKWQKTAKAIKKKYIEEIFKREIFHDKIYYSLSRDTRSYKELTVITVASAINSAKETLSYKASIFIDGLQKSEVSVVSTNLRQIGVNTEKVRGVRDESNSIIRLADAIAGFIREYTEGKEYSNELYKLGIKNKTLQETGIK